MTTPRGALSLAQENLRQTLAGSTTWQQECNADNPSEAADHVYHDGLPKPTDGDAHTKDELKGHRPYAIIYTSEEAGFSRTIEAIGDGGHEFNESGQIMLRFERDSPDNHNDQPTAPANTDWKNVLGEIIDEMCGLAGLPGYLAFHTITLVEGPYWSHPEVAETQGVSQGALVLVQW